jgi:hypothetical protein
MYILVEDVLSCPISKAFDDGELFPVTLCKKVQVPTHVLYADDIIIFCKGSKKKVKGKKIRGKNIEGMKMNRK